MTLKSSLRAPSRGSEGGDRRRIGDAIGERLDVTRGRVERLEQALRRSILKAASKPCAAVKSIVSESSAAIQEKRRDSEGVLDIAVAGGAQRVERDEIAG